ncbi:MAG: hypothetical protein VZR12_00955 [Candidatus Cryptobacteroides sp.]|nr:hypothetical protein [Bacteroidales bacterium]MBR6361726.1 hypothetical protein [Bacteroidales bacterium]MEE3406387.1 hypothetical protein [Candidatus Cryptobacteroides sp.]
MGNNEYKWKYTSVGRAVRVSLESGADIAHLPELDRKKWTVLSCPVNGLEFDKKTLDYLDTDKDGKIRVEEVMEAAKWVTSIISKPDDLLKGNSELSLSDFNTDNPEGLRLRNSARQILDNLHLDKGTISLDDTSDSVRIFAETQFNGDGIITPASAQNARQKELIENILATIGKETDRSGADGIDADKIEAFYAACADYAAWKASAEADKANVFPYGDNTQAALDACNALKDKIADYFMRCKLISFDAAVSDVVDVSVEKLGAISDKDLAAAADEIATYPLARPVAGGKLPLAGGINPAWQAAFASLKALVFDVDYPGADGVDEAQWNAVLAKFGGYQAWLDAKKGAEIESLGEDAVKAILAEDRKGELLELIAKDKALEEESLSIDAVDKLMHYYKYFYKFLCNYVVFSDFYTRKDKAMFQVGRLYIDQRSTDLCIRVLDPGKTGDISSLSGMYILYCTCVSKATGQTMNIAAVLTDGDVDGLRVGKHAIFYDRNGLDWDATVTQIVDNPLSLKQAFWAPYKKVGRWISDKIDKQAEAKNDAAMADLTAKADAATTDPKAGAEQLKSSFDIAKFAGIFAAIGMALGFIGQALVSLAKGAANLGPVKVVIAIFAVMLVISLPSMFITWRKLRKRDLGPVLNANGWAINASSFVGVKFGRKLTRLAKYPRLTSVDPKARRRARLRTFLWILAILVIGGAAYAFFTDRLACIGLPFHKAEPAVECVEETPAEAPVEEAAAEVAEEAPAEEAVAE